MDIEEDVLQAAKELAQQYGSTAGRVIPDLARRGLNKSVSKRRSALRRGVLVLPSRGELVTLEHVQKIRDDEGM